MTKMKTMMFISDNQRLNTFQIILRKLFQRMFPVIQLNCRAWWIMILAAKLVSKCFDTIHNKASFIFINILCLIIFMSFHVISHMLYCGYWKYYCKCCWKRFFYIYKWCVGCLHLIILNKFKDKNYIAWKKMIEFLYSTSINTGGK